MNKHQILKKTLQNNIKKFTIRTHSCLDIVIMFFAIISLKKSILFRFTVTQVGVHKSKLGVMQHNLIKKKACLTVTALIISILSFI